MKKYYIDNNWNLEEVEDFSDIFLLVIEQNLPTCSYVYKTDFCPNTLQDAYQHLKGQYTEAETDGPLNIYIIKVPNTHQINELLPCCDSLEKGNSDDAIEAINNILNRADCEILESWHKEPLTEKKHKKKKPYNSMTFATGCPDLDIDFFNSRFGTDTLDLENPAVDTDCGGACMLAEAQGEMGRQPGKRYIKRYYIRPQNIFCSKKSDILKALVQEVGDNNCSVYSLKSLADHDDVHLLQPSDIIYYYDEGILYDKNHVKVMDYDLNVKHEEERSKFADIDKVSADRFKAEYEDRLVETLEKVCCICGEPYSGYGNNPAPVSDEGKACDACNAKFVIPARLELGSRTYSAD